jgi:Tfp pilus assembly protein PilF
MVEAKTSNTPAAMEALEKAQALDPNLALVYLYRGGIYQAMGRWQDAAEQYGHALALEPLNEGARNGLQSVQAELGKRR